MKKWLTILLLGISSWTFGQHGLAFYHLRNGTFQNTNYNPAYMPHGKFFLGLPVISGVNVYVNNQLSFNDVITSSDSTAERPNGGRFIDVDNAIQSHGMRNIISANVHVSLFHIGFRLPDDGPAFSFFVNERIESDVTYPKSVLQWAWDGNGSFLGRNMNFNSLGISTNYFREYGLGIAMNIPDRPITVGFRAKMYQGIVNVSTPASMKVRFRTHQDDFALKLTTENLSIRTAGLGSVENVNYLINNGNKGFGIDVGMEYKLNRYYQVAFSATDLGFISWNEDVETFFLNDTTARYSGVNLRGSRNLERAFQDSVLGDVELEENNKSYFAPMVGKLTASWIYTPMKGVDVISTVHTRIVQNQPKMGFGVGVRGFLSPKVIGSASITRVPQQWMNIGTSFAVTAGPVQFYASADKILGYSVPNMRWAEFRLGMNLVFGNGKKEKKSSQEYQDFGPITDSKGVISNTFLGQPVKVKRQDGIYTVIKKQKKDEPTSASSELKKVRKAEVVKRDTKSATGTIINNDKVKRKLESATGKTERNDRKGLKFHSATGTVNTSERPGRRFHSATGQNRSDHRREKKIKSATGKVNTNDRKGLRFHSATGQNRNDYKATRKTKSATGTVNKSDSKGGRVNRSASGKVINNDSKGGRVNRSATGANRSHFKKKKNVKSATGKNRNSSKKRRN